MDRAVDEEVVGVADEQMVEVNFNFAILRMLCRLFRAEMLADEKRGPRPKTER